MRFEAKMTDRFKDYKACTIRDLGFHAPTAADEALIADYCKLRRSEIIGLAVCGAIALLTLISSFTQIGQSITGFVITLIIALSICGLAWLLFGYKKIHAVGVIHGRIDAPHQNPSDRHGRPFEDGEYTLCVFDETKQKVEDTVLPMILLPKNRDGRISRSIRPEPGTDIMVVKVHIDRYFILYPEYYHEQQRTKTNGLATNNHETDYSN